MLQARNKSENEDAENTSLLLDRFDNGDGDDNGNDDEDDERDNEAYPSLLARGACRIHSLVCVLKTVTTVRRNRLTTNAKTCPTSVSFSTVAAVVSMTLMVSSCCSTRTLIYKYVRQTVALQKGAERTSLKSCASSVKVLSIFLMSS